MPAAANKTAKTKAKAVATKKAQRAKAQKYSYIGTTSDGVKIIRPKMKATHFSAKDISDAIARLFGPSAVKTTAKKK